MPLVGYLDAISVFAAITASFIKIPAGNAMLSHVQYVRELMDTRVLSASIWTDTRDMIADGTTKGAVDRAELHACMMGRFSVQHAMNVWRAKGSMPASERVGNTAYVFAFQHCRVPPPQTSSSAACPSHVGQRLWIG